jgi:hypothetical protein
MTRKKGATVKTLSKSFSFLALCVMADWAHAQVPVGNDTTDGYGNTGMGTNALFEVSPGISGGVFYGYYNTATGYQALYSNNSGSYNSATGYQALYANTSGTSNTAYGFEALSKNTIAVNNTAFGAYAMVAQSAGEPSGSNNTAVGALALSNITSGSNNTAIGDLALGLNTSGLDNTAVGSGALVDNTTGLSNTAVGNDALSSNVGGNNNVALGQNAMVKNTSGSYSTASGYQALYSNTTGEYNTATGWSALFKNEGGHQNTAYGANALHDNKAGFNTAVGYESLQKNTGGQYNVAVGWEAGLNLTTGSYNIEIGSPGESTDGVAANSAVIRIGTIIDGTSSQSAAFIAGIYGVTTGSPGAEVFIDSSGQLGTVSSSIRYKEDVQPMAEASDQLLKLRPVKFRYKKPNALGEKPIQYGLIAEEVAQVYPKLVVRDRTTGRIDTVRYDELAPMLLNEAQRQRLTIAAQAAEIRDLKQQMAELKNFKAEFKAALSKLQNNDQRFAQR